MKLKNKEKLFLNKHLRLNKIIFTNGSCKKVYKNKSCLLTKPINEIININEFLIETNHKLNSYSFFILKVKTNKLRKNNKNNYHKYILNIIYLYTFIIHRVFPKISFLKYLYYKILKYKSIYISKAEILGRLIACGFKITSYKEINNYLYIISKKVKPPAILKNSSYGPLFKMNSK